MSHYTVAVFTKEGQSVEDLLAPFDESIEVEPYVSQTKEEIISESKEMKKRILERIKEPDYEVDGWEREYLSCETDEDFYKAGIDYEEQYDEDGGLLSTYNPNSKWDWYSIGGRWSGLLKRKDGLRVDSCLVKDLDRSLDSEAYNEAVRFWELIVEKQPLKDGEKMPFNWYKEEYYFERYGTKDEYARQQASLQTYAVLTPDGEWYEPGKMGWWGISHAGLEDDKAWDKNYYKFFEQAEDDWTITIVDCHI